MTTAMSAGQPETGNQAAVRHLASGMTVDPYQLLWQRERNGWSRQDLIGKVRQLYLDGHPDALPEGLTRDAVAKIENGERKPKPATLRALRAALSCYGEPVAVSDLLPGAPRRERSAGALEREARLEHNRKLREFAVAIGRPELAWSRRGRARYTRELERLYAEYAGHLAARSRDGGTALAS